MTRPQRAKLNRLGFSWHPDLDFWEEHFKAYRKFVQIHGHPLVPAQKKFLGLKLGAGGGHQRQCFKSGTLKPERKALFDDCEGCGFAWDVEEWTWEQRFAELKQFEARFEHCRVPAKIWLPNPKLGNWLSAQRSRWDQLPASRRQRLEQLGVERTVPRGLPVPDNVSQYVQELKRLPA